MKFTTVLWVSLATATAVLAQVSVTEKESADKSSSRETVSITTMDRTVVPQITETKETKVDATTTRTESVTRARLDDGTYFSWLTSTTVQRQVGANAIERNTDVTEKDRQGGTRMTSRVTETITRTANGEQLKAAEYRRNSSGQLVLNSEMMSTTTRNAAGTLSIVSTETTADINGKLVPTTRTETTVTPRGQTEQLVSAKTSSFNHLDGRMTVTAQETGTVRNEGNTIRTERAIETRVGASWRVTSKITVTETRAADGTVRRETIESGAPTYAKDTTSTAGQITARRKVIESEVRKPDGTIVLQRDVLRRDVNGDWKPQSFSTVVDEQRPGAVKY